MPCSMIITLKLTMDKILALPLTSACACCRKNPPLCFENDADFDDHDEDDDEDEDEDDEDDEDEDDGHGVGADEEGDEADDDHFDNKGPLFINKAA